MDAANKRWVAASQRADWAFVKMVGLKKIAHKKTGDRDDLRPWLERWVADAD